jgi:hypothetical protein
MRKKLQFPVFVYSDQKQNCRQKGKRKTGESTGFLICGKGRIWSEMVGFNQNPSIREGDAICLGYELQRGQCEASAIKQLPDQNQIGLLCTHVTYQLTRSIPGFFKAGLSLHCFLEFIDFILFLNSFLSFDNSVCCCLVNF